MGKAFLLRLVLSAFVIMIVLSGCSKSDSNQSDHEKSQGKKKDELVLAVGGEPDAGFDPTTGWGRYGSPLFQSTLLKRDSQLNIVNDLASSYEVSEDGRVWTVVLRKDVKFSDGKPLTAADVVFTFETAMNNRQ